MTPTRLSEAFFALSARAYGWLLVLRYSEGLRRRFGRDMEETFDAMLRDRARESGVRGVVKGWGAALWDLTRPRPKRVGTAQPRTGGGGMAEGMGWSARVGTDLAAAVRSLVREPRFALTVVGVVAMGLALNATVFSVVNAYLLRPLPFPGSERIVQVRNAPGVSWNEVDHLFDRAVSWDLDAFTLLGEEGARSVRGSWITPGFLETYGISPALGRSFRPEEAEPGAAPVAMISHRLWQDRFGGDPGVLGQSFEAFTSDRPTESESFRIVGVLPEDLWYVNDFTHVLAPVGEDRQLYAGRLRADVSLDRAVAELTELAASRMATVPQGYRAEVVRLHDAYVDGVRPTLAVLQAAVLMVLLIAAANALVLLVVRGTRREREFGVRRALGAGGIPLGRQLLAEGLLLATAAGVAGLAVAGFALEGVGRAVEARLGVSAPGGVGALGLDGTVVLATLAVALGLGVVFGAVSFAMARGVGAGALLQSRGGSDTRARARLRDAMVVSELAFSVTLLAGAALMVQSALNLQRLDLGFDASGLAVAEVGLRAAAYPEAEQRIAVFEAAAWEVRALPEVEGASWVARAPFGSYVNTLPLESGTAQGAPLERGELTVNTVGEGYFETLGVERLAGRGFGPGDVHGAEAVALVSASAAERLWPGGDAVGARIRTIPWQVGSDEEPGDWVRVVGVVGDVEYDTRVEDVGQVYVPLGQSEATWMDLAVRTRPGVTSDELVDPIRAAITALDPQIAVGNAESAELLVASALSPPRFTAGVLVVFAGCAGFLAVFGLYGVVAYAARQRRRDVAIRMAVGADAGEVTGLFLRRGAVTVVAGIGLGVVAALALAGSLAGELHQVAPRDPLTHASVALGLLGTAMVAVWIPARRAARSDPARVLREE